VFNTLRTTPSEIVKPRKEWPGVSILARRPHERPTHVVHGVTGNTVEHAVQRLADVFAGLTGDDVSFEELLGTVRCLMAHGMVIYDDKQKLLHVNHKRTPAKRRRSRARRKQLMSGLAAMTPEEREARMLSMMRHPSFGFGPAVEEPAYVPDEWAEFAPDTDPAVVLAACPALSSAS
jgi:hypothetical protein